MPSISGSSSCDAAALSAAGMDEDVVAKLVAAYAVARALIEAGTPMAVAYSAGKDSTVALLITILAYRDAVRSGTFAYPLVVVTANTSIENPEIDAHWAGKVADIEAYARREGLDIRVRVARPTLADSWVVRVIGGRGLPTFVNSKHRDCSVSLKVKPNRRVITRMVPEMRDGLLREAAAAPAERARRLVAMAEALKTARPVIVVGTRFGESGARGRRMAERGEAADAITVNDAGDRTLPLIADFETSDVWEILAFAGQGAGKPLPAFSPSFDDTRDLYRSATGECPVISSDRAAKAACGARFGCSLCTVSGSSDRSMEVMLAQPEYAYMRPLNDIRNHLVATQRDLTVRRWVGRVAHPETGHVRILPDVYGPEMCERLLGAALTADVQEAERAEALAADLQAHLAGASVRWSDEHLRLTAAAGAPDLAYARRMAEPRFRLIGGEELIAIDFLWARYGHGPFRAMALYDAVYNRGQRFFLPAVEAPRNDRMPEPRWLPLARPERTENPLFCPLDHMAAERPGDDVRAIAPEDTVPLTTDDVFAVNREAAAFFLEYDLDSVLSLYDNGLWAPVAAVHYYLRTGIVSLKRGSQAELARMVAHGIDLAAVGVLVGATTVPESISDAEHTALLRRPAGAAAVLPAEPAARPFQYQIFAG